MSFPKPMKALHQIEISSRCSLRCIYCPSPKIVDGKYPGRTALDMTRETFERALEWVRFYVRQGTQFALNIAGIGESTLHPSFPEFVRLSRESIPNGHLTFATNGIPCEESMVKDIAPYKPDVWVSLHRPEKAGKAVELYRKYGILGGVSIDPSVNANSWAGQVDWADTGDKIPCQWLRDGKVMAFSDGRLSTCCLDAAGIGVVGHVNDPLGSVTVKPYDLCRRCYQKIGDPSWNQEAGVAV